MLYLNIVDIIEHVRQYVQEEFQHEAIIGHFDTIPYQIHISPLMTRAEQNSDKKGTIMDLSWPKDLPVNAGVQKDICLDTSYSIHYPSIDNITDSLVKLESVAQLYKIYISKVFHHHRVDPTEIDIFFFGYKVDLRYFLMFRRLLDFVLARYF